MSPKLTFQVKIFQDINVRLFSCILKAIAFIIGLYYSFWKCTLLPSFSIIWCAAVALFLSKILWEGNAQLLCVWKELIHMREWGIFYPLQSLKKQIIHDLQIKKIAVVILLWRFLRSWCSQENKNQWSSKVEKSEIKTWLKTSGLGTSPHPTPSKHPSCLLCTLHYAVTTYTLKKQAY